VTCQGLTQTCFAAGTLGTNVCAECGVDGDCSGSDICVDGSQPGSSPAFICAPPGFASIDSDEDGLLDDSDNCVSATNADQSDLDADGWGDVCDVCPNDDGLGGVFGCPAAG